MLLLNIKNKMENWLKNDFKATVTFYLNNLN